MTVSQGIYACICVQRMLNIITRILIFNSNAALPFLIPLLFYLLPRVQFDSLLPTHYELSHLVTFSCPLLLFTSVLSTLPSLYLP